jgi:hypothetical protein
MHLWKKIPVVAKVLSSRYIAALCGAYVGPHGVALRSRAGYSFVRRYCASLLGIHLPYRGGGTPLCEPNIFAAHSTSSGSRATTDSSNVPNVQSLQDVSRPRSSTAPERSSRSYSRLLIAALLVAVVPGIYSYYVGDSRLAKPQLEVPSAPPVGVPVAPPGEPASPGTGAIPSAPPDVPGSSGAGPSAPGQSYILGKITTSALRIHRKPNSSSLVLGQYSRGAVIGIICTAIGTDIVGNASWDKTDRGFVSDRYVHRTEEPPTCPRNF